MLTVSAWGELYKKLKPHQILCSLDRKVIVIGEVTTIARSACFLYTEPGGALRTYSWSKGICVIPFQPNWLELSNVIITGEVAAECPNAGMKKPESAID